MGPGSANEGIGIPRRSNGDGKETTAHRAGDSRAQRASVGGLEAVGPLLLRSEAVASSRIEGYQVSTLNLARALVDPRAARGSARTIAANVSAMEEAIARADDPSPFRVGDIEAIHRTLMAREPRATPGRLREVQNWLAAAWIVPSTPNSCRPQRTSAPQPVGNPRATLTAFLIPRTIKVNRGMSRWTNKRTGLASWRWAE